MKGIAGVVRLRYGYGGTTPEIDTLHFYGAPVPRRDSYIRLAVGPPEPYRSLLLSSVLCVSRERFSILSSDHSHHDARRALSDEVEDEKRVLRQSAPSAA